MNNPKNYFKIKIIAHNRGHPRFPPQPAIPTARPLLLHPSPCPKRPNPIHNLQPIRHQTRELPRTRHRPRNPAKPKETFIPKQQPLPFLEHRPHP